MLVSLVYVSDKFIVDEIVKLLDNFLNTDADEELFEFMFWFEVNYIKNRNYHFVDSGGEYICCSIHKNIIENVQKLLTAQKVGIDP
jgi:hypothetical protein